MTGYSTKNSIAQRLIDPKILENGLLRSLSLTLEALPILIKSTLIPQKFHIPSQALEKKAS